MKMFSTDLHECSLTEIIMNGLTERDRQIIGECLDAFANGPFVPDWELPAVCGYERGDLVKLAAIYPNEEDSEDMFYAINGAMNNLTGYPHRKEEELAKRVSASLEEIEAVYGKWRRLKYRD
jgi:hypothetical protein